MIKETYLAKFKDTKNNIDIRKLFPEAHFEVVTMTAKSILAPSKDLLNTYKWLISNNGLNKLNTFKIYYEPNYISEIMINMAAIRRLNELIIINNSKDVYLVCYEKEYPCHRFILQELLNNIIENKREWTINKNLRN